MKRYCADATAKAMPGGAYDPYNTWDTLDFSRLFYGRTEYNGFYPKGTRRLTAATPVATPATESKAGENPRGPALG